jgi:glycogen debranching enzyme
VSLSLSTPASPFGPAFSVRDIPFSYAGSWFGISPVIGEKTYARRLHLVSHQTGLHAVLQFVPGHGAVEIEPEISASPARLTWSHGAGRVELAYESVDTVRLRGQGLGMAIRAVHAELTPFSGTYLYTDPSDGAQVFTDYGTGRRYRVTVLAGTVEVTGAQALGVAERRVGLDGGQPWEVAIEEYDSARTRYRAERSFEEVVKAAEAEFTAFVDAVAPWRSAQTPAAELAAYVLWSATVRPAGFITRPAVLMSKHWMDKVWSWDHCFNALALADGLPELAWHQFRIVFDHQDAAGALPDSITHSEVLYNFSKPPIHGWALAQLRRRLPALEETELAATYQAMSRWTTFWLDHRRGPGQRLAHYLHGNDSGWDNATAFDPERVVQSADLAAFLILQLRELADLGAKLGRDEEVVRWREAAEEIRAAMLELLWTGERFATRSAATGDTWTSGSLLDLMAVMLGEDLPEAVRTALTGQLRAHLTAFGPATELPDSPHYQSDGYWRGPIWAPSTVLVEDGLRRAGCTDLADDVSARFRMLCERSGFAENFDARTGAGLRDRAYTWTASAYLILAAAHSGRSATVPR